MDDPTLPTGPSLDGNPEPDVPGEIEELLRRVPSGEEYQRRAFALLQRYRGEALVAIARCTDLATRQHAVTAARATLRERLIALLAECEGGSEPPKSADPEVQRSWLIDPDLVRMEGEYRAEYEHEVAEAEQRLHAASVGLLSHEAWLYTLDGMSPAAAETAARANLALRLQGMEEELRALTAHHRDRYLRRLRELVAMQVDRWADRR